MKRVRTSFGHVLSVQSRLLGSALDGAHTAGVTTLTMQDCADFDDQLGGTLTLNGTTYTYSAVNDDTSTVVISPALAANADDGDEATLLDPVNGSPQYGVTASVTEDGEDPGDPVEADVASAIVEQLPEGIRGLAGEAVTLTWDENDEATVTELVGFNDQALIVKAMQDETTATGSGGLVTLNLTYQPILNSEHLYWNGVYQPGSQWTRDRWTVTIPDASGYFETGDELVMEYLYRDPAKAPAITYSGPTAHYIRGTGGSYPSSFITSQPLHASTVVGDLLIVSAVGDGGGGPTITDPRFTTFADGGSRKIAVGYATDLSDVVCHVGGQAGALDQFVRIDVLTVHGDGVNPLAYDPARVTWYDVPTAGGSFGSVGGTGHGVIAIIASGYGNTITIDMATHMPAYTDWGGNGATSVLNEFAYRATEPPPSQTGPTNAPCTIGLIGLK